MSRVLHSNVYVVLLTLISGCADAISFLALGQVLVAAMTGNTVFLGLAFAGTGGLRPTGFLVSLTGFMVGALAGATILRKGRHRKGVSWNVTAALALELFGLLVAALWIYLFGLHRINLLIFTIAFSMGTQGATARRIGVNGVPTTVITSMTTGLMESIVWNTFDRARRRRFTAAAVAGGAVAGGAGMSGADAAGTSVTGASGTDAGIAAPEARNNRTIRSEEPDHPPTPGSLMLVWVAVLLMYCAGAAVCGTLEKHIGLHAIWLPICVSAVVVCAGIASSVSIRRDEQRTVASGTVGR